MGIENMYNGRIVVVDLETGQCEEEALEEELIQGRLGGPAINMALFNRYADRGPIIVGTGLLTSTFCPSSCLGVITAKSPLNGSVCHAPLTWQTGIELKLTGFDFLVILGKSEKPVRLWLHDELADLEDSEEIWGKDTWETTDYLRKEHGDDFVQTLVIGPAGENQVKFAQVSENYWGSKEKFGFGSLFGQKNLKAIALRGLGALEVADGFFGTCTELYAEIKNGVIGGKEGVKDILLALGIDEGIQDTLKIQTHRNASCFNCAYPCNTFLKYREAPTVLQANGVEEPGVFVSDMSSFIGFSKICGQDSPKALEKAFRLGLEPTAAFMFVDKSGKKELSDITAELERLSKEGVSLQEAGLPNFYGISPWPLESSPERSLVQAFGIFSNSIPPVPVIAHFEDFGVSQSPVDRAQWWIRRQGLAYILGICPLFAIMAPELTQEKLIELVKLSSGWEDFDQARLQSIITQMIKETIEAGEKLGQVSESLKTENFDSQLKELQERLVK